MLRADGTPLAVPGWMTRPEAAYAEVVGAVRLPIPVLRELQRSYLHRHSALSPASSRQSGGKRLLRRATTLVRTRFSHLLVRRAVPVAPVIRKNSSPPGRAQFFRSRGGVLQLNRIRDSA